MDYVEFLCNFYWKVKVQGVDFLNIKFFEINLSQMMWYWIVIYFFNKEVVDIEDYVLIRLLFKEELVLRIYVFRYNVWQIYDVDFFYLSVYNLSQYWVIENLVFFLVVKCIDFDVVIGFDQEFFLCFESDDVINYDGEVDNDNFNDLLRQLKNYFVIVFVEEIDCNLSEWLKGKELYFSGFKFLIFFDYVKVFLLFI